MTTDMEDTGYHYRIGCRHILLDGIHCSGHECLMMPGNDFPECCVLCEEKASCPGVCDIASGKRPAEDALKLDDTQSCSSACNMKSSLPLLPSLTNRPEEPRVFMIEIEEDNRQQESSTAV